MQFQTSASLVTLALAGALVVPQVASAACYSGADVKTTVVTSELVEPALPAIPQTQFHLSGDCYQNFVFKAYIGQVNGTLAEIVAPNFVKLDNNHIFLQVSKLDPGDYLIELRTNPSVTVNRSLVTVAGEIPVGILGWEKVTSSSSSGVGLRSATANCSTGKKVLGGGVSSSNIGYVTYSRPKASADGWEGAAIILLGSHTVTVYAICADVAPQP